MNWVNGDLMGAKASVEGRLDQRGQDQELERE